METEAGTVGFSSILKIKVLTTHKLDLNDGEVELEIQ